VKVIRGYSLLLGGRGTDGARLGGTRSSSASFIAVPVTRQVVSLRGHRLASVVLGGLAVPPTYLVRLPV